MRYLVLLAVVFSAHSTWASLRCENLFESEVYTEKPWDLYALQFNETVNLSNEQVKVLNEKTLEDVNGTVPPANDRRAESVPFDVTFDLLKVTSNHPVVGWEASRQFKRPDVEIGYCFGRATYLHLLLLKLGVQKESIRKVWAIGPATTNMPDVVWGFHVAIMVYTKQKGWVVIDTNEMKPMTYEAWQSTYSQRSTDGKVRFYITEPEKFGVNTGPYTKLDLGLTLPAEYDWYNHYFVEMLKSFRHEKLADLGLQKLIPEENAIDYSALYTPARKPKNFIEALIDMFWVLR